MIRTPCSGRASRMKRNSAGPEKTLKKKIDTETEESMIRIPLEGLAKGQQDKQRSLTSRQDNLCGYPL